MSRSQRLTFLGLAAVIAIIAVVILVSSGGSDSNDEQAAAWRRVVPLRNGRQEPEGGDAENIS